MVWVDHSLLIHTLVDGPLDSFHLLVLVNSAAVNICVEVFVWTCVFISLG